MTPTELNGIVAFLRAAEALKTERRSAHTSDGEPESVAAHTWRLCLMALVFEREVPDVDFPRLIKLCVIHDLGEAISGDIPAVKQTPGTDKSADERADLLTLLEPLPTRLRDEITALWDEYEAASTPEARVAKALDKLETILQHNQGHNPADFDYRFNLEYGKKYTSGYPFIEALRALVDAETEQRAREAEGSGE